MISHLSFGKKANFDRINNGFPTLDLQHPLDGFSRVADTIDFKTTRNGQAVTVKKPVGM
jgi:hypothetical protein